jgi:hypothetical protein
MNAMVSRIARKEVSAALQRAHSAAELGNLTDRELLELIRQSPIPDTLLGEARAARKERRAELVAKRERERAEVERDAPALQKRVADAQAAVATKRAELDSAVAVLTAASDERRTRDLLGRYAVAAVDAELERTAAPAIDQFIARLMNRLDSMRTTISGGDYAERTLLMDGFGPAIRKAEELKVTALDGEELIAALKDIEANIAEIGRAARLERGEK